MNFEKRVCVLYTVFVLAVSILLARLYNLSCPDKNEAMGVLEGQYTSSLTVCGRSGFVYDREGFLLSHDYVGLVALINPAECKDAAGCAELLSEISENNPASVIYEKILDGIPFTLTLGTEEAGNTRCGVYLFPMYKENNSTALHFLGYNSKDGKGVCGIRKEYSELLSKELFSHVNVRFRTNAKSRSISDFETDSEGYMSRDGIVSTLDKPLQEFIDGLEEQIQSGAVVVADANSGEILALSSFPGYDADRIEEILNSDKGELVNRVSSSFTPGSVFKLVTAIAALIYDEKLFENKYICRGCICVGENTFLCHKHDGHGEIDMTQAFAHSCNTYFINLGQLLGLDKIVASAKLLGLDKPAEANFISEQKNFFIDEHNSSEGYLANISFGQGDLCLSPLDMTRCTIAASRGYLPDLTVIRGFVRNGEYIAAEKKKTEKILDEKISEKLRIMMRECIKSGTGIKAAADGVEAGGKTATAQTGRFDENGVEYVHKWFCGSYYSDKNEFAVCVFCENVSSQYVSPSVIFSRICSFLKERGL